MKSWLHRTLAPVTALLLLSLFTALLIACTFFKGTQDDSPHASINLERNSHAGTIQSSADRSYNSGSNTLSYEWKINGTTVSHSRDFAFALGPGKHDILLTVTDANGLSSSVGAVVLVRPRIVIIMPGVCTETGEVFSEDPKKPGWGSKLKHDLLGRGIPADDIIQFSYSTNEKNGWQNSWKENYTQADTLEGIVHASNNLAQIYLAYPDVEFDIIAHSLGGVVALDTMNRFPFLRERTHRIITVDSPLRGIGEIKEWLGPTLCDQVGLLDPSHLTWKDLDNGSDIIKNIHDNSWNDLEVFSFGYKNDKVVPAQSAFLEEKGMSVCVEQSPITVDQGLSATEQIVADHSFLLRDQFQRAEILRIALKEELEYHRCSL